MNKLLITATALFALASCAKEQVNDIQTPAADGGNVMVSFVAEPNTTRAFFDPSTATEVWEKTLSSLSVFAFDASGNLLVRRSFTSDEVTAKKATFALPKTAAGTSVEFYAVGNAAVGEVATKTALLALTETAASGALSRPEKGQG